MTEPQSQVRYAIVGCGRFGQHLVEVIRRSVPELRLAAAVAHPRDDVDRVRRFVGAVPIHGSLDALLENGRTTIDAVILASANRDHAAQSIQASAAGKHVFCEKPMAVGVADCVAMVAAATRNGIKLMVGHKRRLRPTWRKLLEIARSDRIGKVVAANIQGWHHHHDIPDWWLDPAIGGGLLERAGCHDIDFLHALLGESLWVRATASPNARGAAASFSETMWLNIGYRDGAVAGLQVSLWFDPVHFRDSFAVQVLGTKGSAILRRHAQQPQELIVHSRGEPAERFAFDDDGTEAYRIELASFARWIQADEPPVLTWREGLACVQVMRAAYLSSERGGERIDLARLEAWPNLRS
jgi:predicted dehydrogenase